MQTTKICSTCARPPSKAELLRCDRCGGWFIDKTELPLRLSKEDSEAMAVRVANLLTERQLQTVATQLSKSIRSGEYVWVWEALLKRPIFWLFCGLVGVLTILFASLTAWRTLPGFVKDKAKTDFDAELATQMHLHFQQVPFSNIVVAVVSNEASTLMQQQVSPAIERFDKGLREKENEIRAVQNNLANIQKKAESDAADLRSIADVYSRMTYEAIPGVDTNLVAVRTFSNNVTQVFLKLKHIPVPTSIDGIIQSPNNTQSPLAINGVHTNIVWCFFNPGQYHEGSVFSFKYATNRVETNLVEKVDVRAGEVYMDGRLIIFK